MKISTNWLRDFVTLAPPLENIAERLTMAGLEVKKIDPTQDRKDTLFEIEITSNRPDWLSHFGVAREIAAVENLSLKAPPVENAASRPMPAGWKINLRELTRCPYYTGVYMEGVTPGVPTPDFIRERLAACGLRSFSLIIDITNYVLLETGQPLHAFDADLLKGQEIQIRTAKAGENFVMIDGLSRTLQTTDLVIADKERAVALAGVMGGKETELTERTRNIFLESAFFQPAGVRQTSRRHGLSSESSYRFERRVDPEWVDLGRERAVTLIRQYAKPRFVSGVIKAGQRPATFSGRIHLTAADLEKNLGIKMKPHQVSSILLRLGFDVKQSPPEAWNVGVPSYRCDVTRPVDLIEEVARIHGYDQIPGTLPAWEPILLEAKGTRPLEEKARDFLTGIGFFETVTFSLISGAGLDEKEDLKNAVSIINPQNRDLKWMRGTFLTSFLQVIQKNASVGEKRVPIFEIANLYRQKNSTAQPEEEKMLALALYGTGREKTWMDPERRASYYDLKGAVESFLESLAAEEVTYEPVRKICLHATCAEAVLVDGKPIGFLGEVSQSLVRLWDLESEVYYGEISLEKLAPWLRRETKVKELPKFPSIQRDMALVVQESVKAGAIRSDIRKLGGTLVRKVEIFDLFRGGRVPRGHKNVAFRVTYQSHERTLVSQDIQNIHSQVAAKIAEKYQASFQL